ncbi:hypothetical protein CXB51_000317 [Gossypium anomalum]|uniref:Protein kinase domain-containing protein n=1 Tax=Gossypium anomalum TaxID=47600 RepID=A0A8J5Z8Y8_9ROSI|nr:hypothetical protein CXB51_000317 [Gossypium anomalum]
MPKPKPQLPLFGLMAVIALFLLPEACIGRNTNKNCGFTMCGNVNISYPFQLTTQPSNCGDHRFELECDNNNNLVMKYGRFNVQNISYDNCTVELSPNLGFQNISCETMKAMDANLSKDDNCSLPRNSFRVDDFCKVPYMLGFPSSVMFLVNCSDPMNSSSYINASRCPTRSSYFYFLDRKTTLGNFSESCTIDALFPIMVDNIRGMSTSDIYEKLLLSFDLELDRIHLELDGLNLDFCRETEKPFQYILSGLKFAFRNYMDSFVHFLFHGPHVYSDTYPGDLQRTYILCLAITGGVIFLRWFLGIICLFALITYKWRRRHLSMDDTIEEFLQSQNNLVPIRYSFKEIKKMTKNFKNKLGEGGYGSVFKGKLRSGHHVAIKLLGKSKGNGQDFINEVASIGRIHHANVAKLIGFCVEGSKQALVYDFIIVSLTAARGTIGYIAPELVYKNLGGISYKADVCSFGMLLMEMVGRRKNVNAFANHTSQIYFPSWIYDRLDQEEDLELRDVSNDEKVIVKKLVITTFWCIQLLPSDRPSMSKVLKMLESDVELLNMPPKPFHQLPLETSMDVHSSENTNDELTTSLDTRLLASQRKIYCDEDVGCLVSFFVVTMIESKYFYALGIHYLHQGCDMQILGFDIKPHNILLDENFNPKVFNFGLAKLYSVDSWALGPPAKLSLLPAFALFVILFPGVCFARHLDCGSTFCGNLNISFPFRLKNQPPHCGCHDLEFECDNNNRTILVGREGEIFVQQFFYENYRIRVVDASLDTDDCNSLPLSSVYYYYDSLKKNFSVGNRGVEFSIMYVVNCTEPIKSSRYIEVSRCTTKFSISSSLLISHFYFLNGDTHSSYINQACTIEAAIPIMGDNITGMNLYSLFGNNSMPKLKAKLPLLGHLMPDFALFVILFPGVCLARQLINQDCGSTFCGNLNISFPFRLKNQPPQCGLYDFELECENNNRTTVVAREGKFFVQQIFYENYTIQMVDTSLDTDDCNSLPLSSLYYNYYFYSISFYIMYVVNCTEPINSSLYIEASRCTTKSNTSSSLPTSHFYFLDAKTRPSDFNQACTIEAEAPIIVENITGMSTPDIYKKLLEGFWVEWSRCQYQSCYKPDVLKEVLSRLKFAFRNYMDSFVHFLFHGPHVYYDVNHSIPRRTYILCLAITGGIIFLRSFPGIICLFALVTYKWRRRHLSMDDTIEEFLQSQNNLVPIRYSFNEIKKMTKNFKDKLGEGGYGSVFKGKLRSGHHVAIKLLGKSKGNGQDFINEVASIGRIHHANVAKLIGFCVEGSKQALVYDFIIVSLTAARGTIGYIAPELVYKNLGGISYKADVYSFGMLLMEMVGRRKNVNAFANHTSQIYFPSWIYDRLDQGEDLMLGDVSDNEKAMVKKMVITAFWCIQLLPSDRPSMSKVLKMLESDVEILKMPLKPFHQLPLETSMEVHSCENSNDESSISLDTGTITS